MRRIFTGAFLIMTIGCLIAGQQYPWVGAVGVIGIAVFFGLVAMGRGVIGGQPSRLYVKHILDVPENTDYFEHNVDIAKGIIIVFSLSAGLCGLATIAFMALREL